MGACSLVTRSRYYDANGVDYALVDTLTPGTARLVMFGDSQRPVGRIPLKLDADGMRRLRDQLDEALRTLDAISS